MSEREPSGAAVGFTAFAGVMMIMIGVFQMIAGFAAILEDEVYVKGADYILQLDTTTWGWIHLLIGLVLFFAGFGVFAAQVWARTVGVIAAGVSAIAQFAFLLGWNYPLWSILIIALDVSIIWALTVHGKDILAE